MENTVVQNKTQLGTLNKTALFRMLFMFHYVCNASLSLQMTNPYITQF
jgi:hypothetical protein